MDESATKAPEVKSAASGAVDGRTGLSRTVAVIYGPKVTDQRLSARLAQIAREVHGEDDVSRVHDRIIRATAELFDGRAEVGISIAHRKHRVENGAATSESASRGDELQTELGEGPCLDAVWDHEQVVTGDLAHDARWPVWGPRMAERYGIQSMLSTQLFTSEDQLGALNVYSTDPDAFDEQDQEMGRLLGAHMAVAVSAARKIEGLRLAVDRRTTIGKALGVIMVTYDLDDDRAFAVLQRLSSHENRKLYDVAQDVVRDRALPSP
jgi:GAF domain-containing protein